jgi:hypothetical protein
MKLLVATLTLVLLSSAANAQLVSLVCKGSDGAGKAKEYHISFDETQNWATEGVIKMNGGVTPQRIKTFLVEVNRMTGEFATSDHAITGACEKEPVGKF